MRTLYQQNNVINLLYSVAEDIYIPWLDGERTEFLQSIVPAVILQITYKINEPART